MPSAGLKCPCRRLFHAPYGVFDALVLQTFPTLYLCILLFQEKTSKTPKHVYNRIKISILLFLKTRQKTPQKLPDAVNTFFDWNEGASPTRLWKKLLPIPENSGMGSRKIILLY